MYCKNLKYRTKKGVKYTYCSFLKKEIKIDNCNVCSDKEYKTYKPIKKRTQKLVEREKRRFSIIYRDLTKCCVCGLKCGIELNEVFEGSYRQRSIDYGMVTPMCQHCHKMFHNNSNVNLFYKVMFQKEFMKDHTLEEFINIFGQDYIYKQQKRTRK